MSNTKKPQNNDKKFVVRKYIMAPNAIEALKKERRYQADDCWVDDKWLEQQGKDLSPAIGFSVEHPHDE